MTTDKDPITKEEIPQDQQICSIQFFYDGLTGTSRYRIKSEDTSFVDPLNLYASACVQVMEKYSDEIIETMQQYIEQSPVSYKIH